MIAVFYPEDERFLVERDPRASHFDVDAVRGPALTTAPSSCAATKSSSDPSRKRTFVS